MVWEGILMFLWLLYHLEAEAMPNRYTLPGEKTLESPFPEKCSELRDPDLVQRLVNGFRQTVRTQATDIDTSMIGPGTFRGAVKALPHMTRSELYWEYAAFSECRGISTGSYGTFMRVINKVIGPNIREGHLRFRATNEHGQCDTCFELRKACREAKTEAARQEARSRHHMHVLSQWLDRQIYWSFRHEDVDQAFSQQAALISRHEFSTPQELIALMDDSFRPGSEADALRKEKTQTKVKAMAYKLDEVADWKEWSRALGIRLLGLRILVEEIPGYEPHGSDVLLFVKRYMADPEPFRVVALVPAFVCKSLRLAFHQPVGICARRPIAEAVRKNIHSFAPQCAKQKIISQDALSYLLSWVDGELQLVPRPRAYPFMNLRRHDIRGLPDPVGRQAWQAPRRFRVFNFARDAESDVDSDEGAVALEDGA
eukprot:s2323_g8.t1